MKVMNKSLLAAAAIGMALNAYAVQKDITVTATVDSSIEVTSADGSALPSTINLNYLPGVGLQAGTIQAKIWSNTKDKDISVRLLASPELISATGGAPVPLKVSFGGTPLTTSSSDLLFSNIFPTGDMTQGSLTQPLVIEQATQGPISSGSYSGTVSLVVVAKA